MKRNQELIKWLIQTNAIKFDGQYASKSGEVFNYETDIREAFDTFSNFLTTSEKIFDILNVDFNEFDYFLGIPETGSIIAHGMNQLKYLRTGKDFKFNLLRAVQKEYQAQTKSVHTVLPLNFCDNVCIIEDDVVSGKTLFGYLDIVKEIGINVSMVIPIIDREIIGKDGKTVKERIEKEYGIPYQAIITLNDTLEYIKEDSYGTGGKFSV